MATEIRHTTCVLDCPDACGLEVVVEDGALSQIRGRRDHPDTAGFICSKVARFERRLAHPDRLLYPLRRTGPRGSRQFERTSWESAISEIVERFSAIREEWGAEGILPFHYGGSNGAVTDELIDDAFFSRLGTSRLAKTICAVPATEVAVAMYGKMPGVAFADYPKAGCIVVWGANPKVSNIHLAPYLKQAKRRGAYVVSVDPRQNLADGEIDLHLPVLPGSDLPLALALIAEWERTGALDLDFLAEHAKGLDRLLERARPWSLERAAEATGVAAAEVAKLAEAMVERSPTVVRCGWGLERNRFGAQAIAAVLALPALLGKFGAVGGGYTLSNNGAAKLDRDAVIGPTPWSTRKLNMTRLGRLLTEPLDPPLKALFVYNANPVATVPDQGRLLRGLARDDLFVVTHDQVMTDTALCSDLVLPAPTFLEGHDLRVGYGSYVVGGVQPVLPAPDEARSNMQLFAELARAFGWDDECFTLADEELVARAAAAVALPGGDRPDAQRIAAGGQHAYSFEGASPVQFGSVTPMTADGKIDLAPAVLGDQAFVWSAPESDRWPLALVTPASRHLINSTFGEHAIDTLEVSLHPSDAAARGLANGTAVRVFNDLGEVHCRLLLDDRVRPGVASMPKGAWRRSSANGQTSTALCPDHVQTVGGAACFNDARVEVAGRG